MSEIFEFQSGTDSVLLGTGGQADPANCTVWFQSGTDSVLLGTRTKMS